MRIRPAFASLRAASAGTASARPTSCGRGIRASRRRSPKAKSNGRCGFTFRTKTSIILLRRLDAQLTPCDGGYRLKLTAKSFIRDLAVFIDRLDPKATISDQLITLLPGESVGLTIRTDLPMQSAVLLNRPVMQCANYYGTGNRLPPGGVKSAD